MSISEEHFGTMPTGEEVRVYTVDNGRGLKAEFLNLGCVIRRLTVKDKHGKDTDVVLGRDSFEEYIKNPGNFGATVGRCANRIRHGKFTIGGREYLGEPNQRGHLLHSGWANFALRVWQASYESEESNTISFEIKSPDGENGFPGNIDAVVSFTLDDTSLVINYKAVADKDTIMNFTNHSYFNLNGHASGDVLNHELRLNAGFITPTDDEGIPTGEIVSVKNTPFDFTETKAVGRDLSLEGDGGIKGYDDNFVIGGTGLREAAYLKGDKTGITMITVTDKPGLQIYTPLFLKGDKAYKDGAYYNKYQGICLESQFFPNSIEYSHFPSPVVKCGDKYEYTTVYSFGIE